MRLTNTLFKPIDRKQQKFSKEGTELGSTSMLNIPSKKDLTLTKKNLNDSVSLELFKPETMEIPPAPIAHTDTFKEPAADAETTPDGQIHSARASRKVVRMEMGGKLGEQGCVICCAKMADAVLLPCNHGGLCFDCANKLSQQSATCHFCRKVVIGFASAV